MITVKRKNTDGLIVDDIYLNNKLQFEQSNLTGKNRFGAGTFKANNGRILNVSKWIKI